MRVGVGLGSNEGDRLANLSLAIRRLYRLHDKGGVFLLSSVYETKPLECPPGSPDFFNAVAEIESERPPHEILALFQRWEVELGRPAQHEFHSQRTIDLDILYCGSLRIHDPKLTLPHPQIAARAFVRIPLLEILPELANGRNYQSLESLGDMGTPHILPDDDPSGLRKFCSATELVTRAFVVPAGPIAPR